MLQFGETYLKITQESFELFCSFSVSETLFQNKT